MSRAKPCHEGQCLIWSDMLAIDPNAAGGDAALALDTQYS